MIRSFIDEDPQGPKAAEYKKLLMDVYAKRLSLHPDERPGWVKGQQAVDMLRYKMGTPQEIIALVKEVIALSDARVPNGESIDAVVLDLYFKLAMNQ